MRHLKRMILLIGTCLLVSGCSLWLEPVAGNGDSEVVQEAAWEQLPAYEGNAYVILNDNSPGFTEKEKSSKEVFEYYSQLDELGRCGVAYANICKELEPTEERGAIGEVKPSGWQIAKYPELIQDNYLYNRCHLIGYQLAGENANEKNLITGTRYMNVQGMLPFENMVHSYVEQTGNHVLYRVTPIFEGNNLVASGVQMEAWSVEDEGEGICFHVFCFNRQPGIEIDYATGESWEAEEIESGDIQAFGEDAMDTQDEQDTAGVEHTERTKLEKELVYEFVLNKNTHKIHLPDCPSVKDMAEKNKEVYRGTLQDIMEQDYAPCWNCVQPLLEQEKEL